MGSKLGIIQRPWTDAERETLRRLVDDGKTLREVAEVLGRTRGSVQTMASKHGLVAWENILPATKESIRFYAAEGWASSRIARRLRVPVKAVDAWTGRTPA